MRRNNMGGNRMGNQGGGFNQINMNRNQLPSSGPLMTDHLQLRELDLELALLKRKREIIEEQHSMLVNERVMDRPNPFGFNQPSQSFNQQRSEPIRSRNFSDFYEGGSRRGTKRPAIDPWDSSAVPPKRFNGPPRRRPNASFTERSRPQPKPLMSGDVPKPKFSGKPFAGRPQSFSNKPGKRPGAPNRSSLPTERKDQVKSTPSKAVSYVLEADKPPHPSLVGRLELALGHVMRQMREALGERAEYSGVLASVAGQRSLKATIRERIRALMLGKEVGANAEVMAAYRAAHPADTDAQLLDHIRDSLRPPTRLAIQILQRACPEKYFKININNLLMHSLEQMFGRMQLMYKKLNKDKRPPHVVINELLLDFEKSVDLQKLVMEDNSTENAGTAFEENKQEVNDEAMPEENGAPQQDASQTEENETGNMVEENDTTVDGNAAAENATDAQNNSEVAQNTMQEETNEENIHLPEEVTKMLNRTMETLINMHLPRILPKFTKLIFQIIREDAYKETEDFLIKTANEKIKKHELKRKSPVSTDDKKIFYVRVVGRPKLPKKEQMKAFLDTFEPTFIKKHRNATNILFVSFSKKENVDKILEKDGTVLGRMKLDIKISEKVNNNKDNVPSDKKDTQSATADGAQGDDAANQSLSSEGKTAEAALESLDDQISDLLTSIREEEERKTNGSEEVEPTDVDAQNEANNDENNTDVVTVEDDVTTEEKVDDEVVEIKDDDQENANTGYVETEVETVKAEPVKPAMTPRTRRTSAAASPAPSVRTRRGGRLANN